MSRRAFLARAGMGAGAVLLGGGLLSACGDDDDDSGAASGTTAAGGAATTAAGTATTASGSLQAVNFQLSWLDSVQFGGSYIAKEKGYFAAEGMDITLTPGGPNAPVDPPVIAGQALVGISAADYAGRSAAEGAPFKIIGVAMQKNPFVIASRADNPIPNPTAMVGKKLGMASINQPVLEAIAEFNGFAASDVTVIPTQYDAAPLVNGEVDCILCWLTDLPVAMTVQGIPNQTFLLADYGYAVHSQTYIATIDSLANNRELVMGLLRAEIKGWQDYKADTAAAAKLTVDMFPDLGLDLKAQELQAAEQVKLMFSPDTDEHGFLWFTDESVAENVETLGKLGVVVKPELWDRTFLEEIFADGPTLA